MPPQSGTRRSSCLTCAGHMESRRSRSATSTSTGRGKLSNPYTGVAAIFSSRLLNGQPPLIFEDGRQTRDFTHVSDIVRANLLALETDRADGEVLNVGTGRRTSLLDLLDLLADGLGAPERVQPDIANKFREGDIRHCYADISKAKRLLQFEPDTYLDKGIVDLVAWARTQRPADRQNAAVAELEARKLVR